MSKTVTEEQLHAYVDDSLSADERAAVEQSLAADPDASERVLAYRAQNEALHRLFDPVLDEPHALKAGAPAAAPRAAAAAGIWRWAGALAATFVFGAVMGALLHATLGAGRGTSSTAAIAHQVVLAHAAYLPEVRHPVEVTASEEQHLVTWLSKRLNTPVRAPSLAAANYRLLGGRLLPPAGEAGAAPVALFMYEDARGRRLSLLARREPAGSGTAFHFARDGATNVFYWIDGPLGYALAGEIDKDELSVIARLVYQQLNP